MGLGFPKMRGTFLGLPIMRITLFRVYIKNRVAAEIDSTDYTSLRHRNSLWHLSKRLTLRRIIHLYCLVLWRLAHQTPLEDSVLARSAAKKTCFWHLLPIRNAAMPDSFSPADKAPSAGKCALLSQHCATLMTSFCHRHLSHRGPWTSGLMCSESLGR